MSTASVLSTQPVKDNFLRIGDYISLKFPKHQAYLSGEGILNEDVYVSPVVSFFEEHIFQIYVQRQYSATNELEEFLEANGGDPNLLDPATASYMEALTKGKENESILNRSVMKTKTGNLIYFGDTIQLLHVKSSKFVTVRPADLARDERENMRVMLSYDGSIMSWIKVMPRFKINREGEPVANATEILLKVSERSNEYLHCADRPPPRGKFREVNSSLESPTGWKVSIFQHAEELTNPALLLAGQLMTIKDPESQAMLAPLQNPINLDRPHTSSRASTLRSDHNSVDISPQISSVKQLADGEVDDDIDSAKYDNEGEETESNVDDFDSTMSLTSTEEFVRDFGNVVMKPITEENIDSDCLWVMESKNIVKGGSLKYKADRVHFRHLNTGKYLAIRLKEDSNDEFVLVLEKDPDERYTLWFIQELHGSDEFLYNTRAVQIKHALFSVYLQRGTFYDSNRIYSCLTTRSKSKALSMIASRYVQPKSVVNGVSIPGEETLDCYYVKSVMYHLQKYVRATEVPLLLSPEMVNATFWPKMDALDRKFFTTLMVKTTLFVRGYPIAFKPGTEEFTKYRGGKTMIMRRQSMLREVGVLEGIMMMVKFLQPLSKLINAEQSTSKIAKSSYVEMAKSVLSECLSLIHTLIKDNIVNQIYISDHLLTILSHISTDKMAAQIAQELLSSNRELQETKIGKKEITIFTQRMRIVHMNSMYLNLLRTCCSCLGKGLPRNQEIVNSTLFHEYKDVLIELRVDHRIKIPLVWHSDSAAFQLFFNGKQDQTLVRGGDLFTAGAPAIRLTWESKSIRFSVNALYNRDEVLLSDVMERDRGLLNRLASSSRSGMYSSKESQNDDHKRRVADFFISQLLLVGEMCLDRNYPVLLEMEKNYPYEILLTILKTSNNEYLKSAVAFVIHHVYINREPQSEIPVPRYTRTLTEINEGKDNIDFVSVPNDSLHQFSLLQILIAEHLEDVQNRPFAHDSLQILRVFHSLMKFHYYGHPSKLSYMIKLLIDCLRRGDFDCQTDMDSEIGLKKISLQRGLSRKTLNAKKASNRITNTPQNNNGANPPEFNKATSSFGSLSERDRSDSSMNLSEKGDDSGRLSDSLSPVDQSMSYGNSFISVSSKKMLDIIESPISHLIMVFIAISAAAVTIYEIITNDNSLGIQIFEAVVLALFVWELAFHMLFYAIVHRSLLTFFYNEHNVLDFLTVALYAVLFTGTDVAVYVKFLRLSRILVIYKLYYAVQDAANILLDAEAIPTYILPQRYLTTSEYTIHCLSESVLILIRMQKNLEDRALSICLKRFSEWQVDPKQLLSTAPDLYLNTVLKQVEELSISDSVKDDIFLDLLMYSDHTLVQATLDLLMMHHSSQKILLDNLNKMQLITSAEDEKQYFELEKMIYSLKRHAETHDIWGKLESSEHEDINNEMHHHLLALVKVCKKRREVLKFNESHEPVKFIQNILRNLGCFEVCMKISQLVLTIDENQPSNDVSKNTRQLAFESNDLLYWFTVDNPTNQAIVYAELKFFMKTVDAKIASHRVISAIFKDNIELMELVPKKYISEFVELICTVGKRPQYLTLMSSIINVGEKNMIRNQYEVIKLMSSPENIKKMTQYFVNTNHPEYQKKIRLMSHYLTVKDITVDELPPDLAYHLELMQLLSSCTIGTSGMTSIEAKVQSMYHFVDIIDAMLDPACLLLGKIRLGLFLFNAALDVETPIPAIKDAACIWRLIIASQDVIAFAKDELRQIEKNGWDSPNSNRQRIEYMLVNVMIVESYFKEYYDETIYKPDFGQVAVGVERVQMKEYQGQEIIQSLFQKIFAIYEMMSPLLAYEHHELLYNTLLVLNNQAKEKIVANVDNIHEAFFKAARDYQADLSAETSNLPILAAGLTMKEVNAAGGQLNKSFDRFLQVVLSSEEVKKSAESQIQGLLDKITNLPRKDSLEKNADVRFEPLIEKLVSHIRSCVTVVILGDDSIKFMNPNATKTSIWILKMFRTMIENRWGMTIYERDDDGGEEQDDAVKDLMKIFNASGMTEMCLDLIAKGIDINLQAEALKLLVGMLFKEGGATDIQKSIYHHLSQSGSDLFFRTVRQILHNLISWHKWNGVINLEDGQDPELPDEIIIVRCLQLMCEGHFHPNQDLFREQPNNYTSINLLDDFVAYMQCLDPIKCRTSTAAELAVSAVVLEVIQGPCEGNQNYFALNTELIETLNRKIRQRAANDCEEEEELELKKSCIDILQALLEGQGRKTAIYERMLSVIHIDVILVLCQGGSSVAMLENGEEESDAAVELKTESLVLLQMLTDFRPSLKVEYGLDDDFVKGSNDTVACIEVVWHGELQRRFFHIPDVCRALAKSSKDDFVLNVKRESPEDKLYGLLEAAKEMYREVKHQEYLQEIHLDVIFSRTNQDRVFWLNFYVACAINVLFILFYTTETIVCGERGLYQSHDAYYEYVAADDGEGDATASAILIANAVVESAGKAIGLSQVEDNEGLYEVSSILPLVDPFATGNSTASAGPLFCTAATIRESYIQTTITALNVLLIVGAVFSLLSTFVVRAPVNFQRLREKGYGITLSSVNTALEFSLLYSALYLVIAGLGLIYHPCLSFLLLDFVKLSPTTQAVLNAVYEPRRAIIMTIVLVTIFMYIYAAFDFFFLVDPAHVADDHGNYTEGPPTVTLGNFVKFLIRYGFPFASPSNQMNPSIDIPRVLNDVSFYLVCLVMVNILKGITIDTFVSLRKKLEARVENTTQRCFICSIEKNTFNRTLDRDAFRQHIKNDQNLWNYIYFIMYIWEQDKDDDDGFESFVRRCLSNNDLTWFPLNKAIRLALQSEKGDVNSLKYRFRKDMIKTEEMLQLRMSEVKDQVGRTIGRIEKALEYGQDSEQRGRTGKSRATTLGGKKLGTVSFDENDPTNAANKRPTGSRGSPTILSARVPSPSLPLLPSRKETTVLDADILGQMHLRMVAVTGVKIPPTLIKFIQVRIISNYEISMVQPLTNLQAVASLSKPGTPHALDSRAPSTMNNSVLNLNSPPQERQQQPSGGSSTEVKYRSKSVEKVSASIKNTRSSFVLNRPKTGDRSARSPQMTGRSNMSDTEIVVNQDLLRLSSDAFDLTKAGSSSNLLLPTANSFYYREKDRLQLRFDILNNSPTLVHEGLLPSSDLSKIVVKIQVVFNLAQFYQEMFNIKDSDHSESGMIFMGGAIVPITTLLTIAHEGKLMDVPFIQNCMEIPFPSLQYISPEKIAMFAADGIFLDRDDDLNDNLGDSITILSDMTGGDGGNSARSMRSEGGRRYQKRKSHSRGLLLIIPSSDSCSITVSSVASHKLLQDWAMIRKRL